MFKAYKKYWKGYVDFEGRSSHSDYWFAVLANILVIFAVGILAGIFIGANDGSVAGPLGTIAILLILAMLIYGLAVVLPFTAIQARRLRDAGYHWAFIFFRFAVGIGGIVLLILFCQPTKVEVPFNNFNNPQQ